MVGQVHAFQIEKLSLEIYEKANAYAAKRGINIANTKFEIGLDESTTPTAVVLIDEVLTAAAFGVLNSMRLVEGRNFMTSSICGVGPL